MTIEKKRTLREFQWFHLGAASCWYLCLLLQSMGFNFRKPPSAACGNAGSKSTLLLRRQIWVWWAWRWINNLNSRSIVIDVSAYRRCHVRHTTGVTLSFVSMNDSDVSCFQCALPRWSSLPWRPWSVWNFLFIAYWPISCVVNIDYGWWLAPPSSWSSLSSI